MITKILNKLADIIVKRITPAIEALQGDRADLNAITCVRNRACRLTKEDALKEKIENIRGGDVCTLPADDPQAEDEIKWPYPIKGDAYDEKSHYYKVNSGGINHGFIVPDIDSRYIDVSHDKEKGICLVYGNTKDCLTGMTYPRSWSERATTTENVSILVESLPEDLDITQCSVAAVTDENIKTKEIVFYHDVMEFRYKFVKPKSLTYRYSIYRPDRPGGMCLEYGDTKDCSDGTLYPIEIINLNSIINENIRAEESVKNRCVEQLKYTQKVGDNSLADLGFTEEEYYEIEWQVYVFAMYGVHPNHKPVKLDESGLKFVESVPIPAPKNGRDNGLVKANIMGFSAEEIRDTQNPRHESTKKACRESIGHEVE